MTTLIIKTLIFNVSWEKSRGRGINKPVTRFFFSSKPTQNHKRQIPAWIKLTFKILKNKFVSTFFNEHCHKNEHYWNFFSFLFYLVCYWFIHTCTNWIVGDKYLLYYELAGTLKLNVISICISDSVILFLVSVIMIDNLVEVCKPWVNYPISF